MPPHHTATMPLRQALTRSLAEDGVSPRAVPFNADARDYEAWGLGRDTGLLGTLQATTLEGACAEATERWFWDRGDRLGIRERGQEDAPLYPFDKQPVDRLHVYAVRRSAPLRYELNRRGTGTTPVYRHKLDHICTIDMRVLAGDAA